jgi:putative ABC transport system ATP-binding protein
VLALRGLSYRYPRGPLLAFPDFEAPAAAAIVLSGRSGSGKSTLIALCAGLLSPQAGELRVAGADLMAMTPAQRDAWRGAALGVVPQRLHLSASLTILENLAMPFVSAGVPIDRARLHQLLEALDIGGLGERRPHEISLGQAQRAALARALVRRPAMLLVDEPTANLDDEAAHAVVDLLHRSAAQATAALMIATHDARVARALPRALPLHLPAPVPEQRAA